MSHFFRMVYHCCCMKKGRHNTGTSGQNWKFGKIKSTATQKGRHQSSCIRAGRASIPRVAVGGAGTRKIEGRATKKIWTQRGAGARDLGPASGAAFNMLTRPTACQHRELYCYRVPTTSVSRFLAFSCEEVVPRTGLHLSRAVCTDSPPRAVFASTACRHPSRRGPGEKGGWMLRKK